MAAVAGVGVGGVGGVSAPGGVSPPGWGNDVPEEVLLCVLDYLSVEECCTDFGPVCRWWHRASLSPLYWRKRAVSCGWTTLQPSREHFLARSRTLRRYRSAAVRATRLSVDPGEPGGVQAIFTPRPLCLFRWDKVFSGSAGWVEKVNHDTVVVAFSAPRLGVAVFTGGSREGREVAAAANRPWSAVAVGETRMLYAPQVPSGPAAAENPVVFVDLAAGVYHRLAPAHTVTVTCIRLSATGRFGISGSYDRSARVWDLDTGGLCSAYHGRSTVWTVDVRPDGRCAAAGFDDGRVVVWQTDADPAAAGAVELFDGGHTQSCMVVRFDSSRPDRVVFTAGYDGKICVWDYVEARLLQTMNGHRGVIHSLTVCEHVLVSCSRDLSVVVWDKDRGVPVREIREAHRLDVKAVEVLPNGDLVSGAMDGTLTKWEFSGRPPETAPAGRGCVVS